MRYCKPLRAFFVLIQVSLTIYFIWYSFDNWEKTPIVTSTEFKTLHNEEFPAVSICFDNTNWKWPALINLASRWVTNKTDLNIASLPWKIPVSEQINFIRNGKSAFMANEYFSNQDFTMDMCKALSVLFLCTKEWGNTHQCLLSWDVQLQNQAEIVLCHALLLKLTHLSSDFDSCLKTMFYIYIDIKTLDFLV